MTSELTLHPIAAALAAAIVRSDDKKRLALPAEAVEKARAQLKATSDPDAVSHLIALAAKTRRIAGDGGIAVIGAIALIVVEKLGSTEEAAAQFTAAGLDDVTTLLGTTREVRAPREQPKAAAPVKPKRGLR